MNIILKLRSIVTLVLVSAFIFSCSSDDNEQIFTPPGSTNDGELIVTESGIGDKRAVNVTGGANGENVTVRIQFVSESTSMRRLYITQDVGGFGEEAYQISTTGVTVDNKKDGSLDLSSDLKNSFDFTIDFPAPMSMDNGTIVYKVWATSGRGDFRDVTKRNVFEDNAVGTITVTFGNGNNSANGIRSFTSTMLAAPLGDFSSLTFMSVYSGDIFRITDGEENAALWDFGYYYGQMGGAALASTDNYPNDIINVPEVAKTPADELFTKVYFKNRGTALDFDAITSAADIDSNVTVSTADSERVTGLTEGDVLEFFINRDTYMKKGVIKVVKIVPGFGTGAGITLDIKVQL